MRSGRTPRSVLVNLMVNGEVVLESMWSPAVAAIQAGVACPASMPSRKKECAVGTGGLSMLYAKVRKGQDSWIRLNANTSTGWLDGWPAAFSGAPGLLSLHSLKTRRSMGAGARRMGIYHWYEGKPAAEGPAVLSI